MKRRSLFLKLLGSFLLLALLVQGLLLLYVASLHRGFIVAEQQRHLEVLARVAAQRVVPVLRAGAPAADLKALCAELDAASGARVTVVRPSGEVAADSRRDVAAMDPHGGRPEVVAALAGRTGHARRLSVSTRTHLLYVAIPLEAGGTRLGVLRLAVAEQGLQALLASLQHRLWGANALLLLLAAGLSFALSRHLSRPLDALRRSAEALAAGSPGVAWPAATTRETAALTEALRNMAGALQEKIATIERLLDEQRAIFDHMADGVLVVDRDDRILDLNRAAEDLLGVKAAAARGRGVLEMARNARLAELVARARQAGEPVVSDLTLYGAEERHLQVHGAALKTGPHHAGALLVLTDVTRLRQLESLRRDFVANASHELKTPVTAIKGFAETLVAGGLDEEQARRFTRIIARQADQLVALIEDLLELTRLEHEAERRPIEREQVELAPILWSAVELCAEEARQKDLQLAVHCPDGLSAFVNGTLVQRALVNLVDNAVKYSGPNTRVEIDAAQDEAETRLTVRDEGCGIPAEHLARIFERFYRVDKSRSRKLGGTGLGLSIVKHVCQAHGGEVRVQSTPGRGSVFTLHLPLRAAP